MWNESNISSIEPTFASHGDATEKSTQEFSSLIALFEPKQ